MLKTDEGMIADRTLVESVADGDIEAFQVLAERYQGMLYRYVGRKISCFADVEDLVQESFIRAFFNLQSFDTDRNFGLWIRAICRNTTYHFLSK